MFAIFKNPADFMFPAKVSCHYSVSLPSCLFLKIQNSF